MRKKEKINKNTPFTAEMAEVYFGSIKEDFEAVDKRFERVEKRLEQVESTIVTVLNIVKVTDVEKKEIRSDLWLHDKRLTKLEGKLA